MKDLDPKATPLGRQRSSVVRLQEKHIAAVAAANPKFICPWCGGRHSRWVGDHLVPLAGARSPLVAAGGKCNMSRIGVIPDGEKLFRLRSGACASSVPSDVLWDFVANWARKRYGIADYAALAMADSGPRVKIRRRINGISQNDSTMQRIADRAYLEHEGLTADDVFTMRRLAAPFVKRTAGERHA